MKTGKWTAWWLAVMIWATANLEGAVADWRPLFNGTDLDGWVNVNCAPGTWTVRDGVIVSTGFPTGVMRTTRHYENFELELEWRHMRPQGNAGLFVWSDPLPAPGTPFTRAIEIQVLDGRNSDSYTSHGDVFGIHGARMVPDRPHPQGWMRSLPSERRAHPSPEWNHYRVLCSNGVVQLAVNGKLVTGASEARPRRGYICLESEGSECHFRNIRIRELPDSNAQPDEVAALASGLTTLYTGVDLSGWKGGGESCWAAKDWILDGSGPGRATTLWTERGFKDFVLMIDWRLTRQPVKQNRPLLDASGDVSAQTKEVSDAGASGIFLRGSQKAKVNIWCWPAGSGEISGYREDAALPRATRAAALSRLRADRPPGQWNRFIITVRGQEVTVVLNGQTVVEKAVLPGFPAEGPIGLEHRGDPVQFANLFIEAL